MRSTFRNFAGKLRKMKQAMIFAAGLGTRLKPLTDAMPKALVRVDGQPLLWHVVMKLKAAGFERIVVNVHHFAQQIIDYLEEQNLFGIDIRISDESDGLLETGGGIKKALPLFDPLEPVLIHNVDIFSNVDLAALYAFAKEHEPDALLLVSRRKTKRYLLFDDEYLLDGWTNIETGEVRSPYPTLDTTALKQLAFSGIHVISPKVFSLFSEMPDRFGIIDFYLKYCHQRAFLGWEKSDLRLLDVGKLDSLHEAEIFINNL
ncbi:MobA-like NTP transferase domain-containing protein [Prevotella aff. ruminicola Tc2-24]|uniref:MobA-like NTP transferase domain-containing protein n=2 Tax=Prevotellaceae TaxID=171552 RepID=A0A1I0MLE1_9BACT|nr:MobA-like NTP transferase domain-containing protein [Prevotella sp. lc2012]SEV89134.1 MobA-like NTP transferase domain-containing protein [Prevotella aff. ruminicola Tc2-24]